MLAIEAHKTVGQIEQALHIGRGQIGDGKEMTVREREGPGSNLIQTRGDRRHKPPL